MTLSPPDSQPKPSKPGPRWTFSSGRDFAGARVLCLGDVMLDRFVHGRIERISPEAPIPIMAIQKETAMLGGAGNVARNVVALGGHASLVAVVGDDDAGREITRLMAMSERLGTALVSVAGRVTTVKTRFVAGTHHMLRADRETVAQIDGPTAARVFNAFRAELEDCDVVVLSNYAKGVLTDQVLAGVIEAARRAGKIILADPKRTKFERYRGIDILKPNAQELADATGMPTESDDQVVAAARKAIAQSQIAAMLVTRSERGMSLIEASGRVTHAPTWAREVYDVSGAGDTVIATLAAGLALGADLVEAVKLANAAAGVVVGKIGTSVVYAEELAAAVHEGSMHQAESKVVPLARALDEIAQWRTKGSRIGFTNGCFDLLHPGHISLLAQSRGACERLVVGLNTDQSVRRLKGPTRPVQNQAARSLVLASLSSVDMVVLFDDETPMQLIEAIRPEVLIKGADYTIDTVVGAPFVQSYGGQVMLANLEAGHSTTNIIERMAVPEAPPKDIAS
jgi:D-beta-D-heptose 7-phosphate kinase/D-beta-D-heptose 1-phosphate adenosyltransferase